MRFQSDFLDRSYYRIVCRFANEILPLYFRLTSNRSKNLLPKQAITNKERIIVSLTSYPARINKVWLTIESILRQQTKPDLILLWLSSDEFADISMLPDNLRVLETRGLQIRFCTDNIMPHKKYFWTMKEFPEACVITVDDDTIYTPDLLRRLLTAHAKFPDTICSAITREIKVVNGSILPYNFWEYIRVNSAPSYKLLSIGAGGVLYPPASLNAELFNLQIIKQIALKEDDLWLKFMSLLNKTKVASIAGEFSRFFIPVIQKDMTGLMDINIGESLNDKVFHQLRQHYNIPVSILESD